MLSALGAFFFPFFFFSGGRALVTHPLTLNLADVGGAGIRNGYDLDQLGFADRRYFVGSEGGPQVDTPVGSQPEQALDGDDGSHPHKGPFFTTDIPIVALSRQIDGQKGWPGDCEGPYVGMKEERFRGQELCRLDLRIVHKPRYRRRHGRWSRAQQRGLGQRCGR